jgi:hypothetical protein
MDTVERLLEDLPPEQIEDVLGRTVARLLRSHKLQALLVEKHYVVAIDGSQKFTRTIPFAKEALHRTVSGSYAARHIRAIRRPVGFGFFKDD